MSLPMALTVCRLLLAPVFFVVYTLASGSALLVAATWLVFCLIELSDLLDGLLARRLGLVTEAGKVLDPLADSVSRLTYFVCFAGSAIMPLWVLLILVYRDVGVSYVRVLFARRNFLMPARLSGKLKAWIYALAGIAGLAVFSDRELDFFRGISEALSTTAFWIFLAAAAVALWSLGDYGVAFLSAKADNRKVVDRSLKR